MTAVIKYLPALGFTSYLAGSVLSSNVFIYIDHFDSSSDGVMIGKSLLKNLNFAFDEHFTLRLYTNVKALPMLC